jgi:hypothetical protein
VPAECIERRLESYSTHLTTILLREDLSLTPTVIVDTASRPLGLAMAERSQSLLDSAEAGHAPIAVPIDSHNWTTLHNGAPAQTSDDVREDTDDEEGLLWWSPHPDNVNLARDASPASRPRHRTQNPDSEGDITSLSAPFRHLTVNTFNDDDSARPFPPETVPGHGATSRNPVGPPSQIFCDPRPQAQAPSDNGSLSVRFHTSPSALETTSVETLADHDPIDTLQVEWNSASEDASSTFQPQADIGIFNNPRFRPRTLG